MDKVYVALVKFRHKISVMFGWGFAVRPNRGHKPYTAQQTSGLPAQVSWASLNQTESGFRLALGQVAVQFQAAGMRMSTSQSESVLLSQKRVNCLFRVGEFKCFRVLLMSEG